MKILTAPQSGSQAGTTASRNRFGQYLRTRAMPVQPRSPKQTFLRAAFTSGAVAWRLLTDVQRTAWIDYARQLTRTDSLGSSYSPTGFDLFTASKAANPTGGGMTDPPATLPNFVLLVTDIAYTDPTPGPEALEVSINTTNANNGTIIETSGPISPGITSAAAVRRWFSLPVSAANLSPQFFSLNASPFPILNEYKFLFPSPVTGNNIWFRFREQFQDGVGTATIVNNARQTFRFIIP